MIDDRIFLGYHRSPNPPTTKYRDQDTGEIKFADVMQCPCGQSLWTLEAIREHWSLGHFDTPIYATREEVIEKFAERIKDGHDGDGVT